QAGADRGEVWSADSESEIAMADEKDKQEKKPKAQQQPKQPKQEKKGKQKAEAAEAADKAPESSEPVEPAPPARLKEFYEQQVRSKLQQQFAFKNPHQIPRLKKIVLNVGMGDASKTPKGLEAAVAE